MTVTPLTPLTPRTRLVSGAGLFSGAGPLPRRRGPAYRPLAARSLLEQARQGLLDAEYAARPVDRYAQAQMSASRAAAAVLAARVQPRRRARPTSVWQLLAIVAPDLAEWSALFAATSATRVAAEAGVSRLVTIRDADDLVRRAGEFLAHAERAVSGTSR